MVKKNRKQKNLPFCVEKDPLGKIGLLTFIEIPRCFLNIIVLITSRTSFFAIMTN